MCSGSHSFETLRRDTGVLPVTVYRHGRDARVTVWLLSLFLFCGFTFAQTTQPAQLVLHIAADPNNLPFSNEKCEGFENKIAQLIADDLGAKIEYTWWAQRRGFFRETLKHEGAELVMGVPREFEKGTLQTRPYYRSGYVFISRVDKNLDIHSINDARLRQLKVGVPMVGDNSATPPAQALSRRGSTDNVIGYSVYSDYAQPNPLARLVEAVARGDVDVGIVWGPVAGYFADKENVPLKVTPMDEQLDPPGVPLAFEICVGVKRGNKELRDKIDAAIARHHDEIEKILAEYHVPRLGAAESEPSAQASQHMQKG